MSGWGEIEVAVKEETFVQFADFRAVTFVRAGLAGLAVGMTRLIKSNGIGRIAAELTRGTPNEAAPPQMDDREEKRRSGRDTGCVLDRIVVDCQCMVIWNLKREARTRMRRERREERPKRRVNLVVLAFQCNTDDFSDSQLNLIFKLAG